MKKVYTGVAVFLLSAFVIVGCQKDSAKDQSSQLELQTKGAKPPTPMNCDNYVVDVTTSIVAGNTLVTWSVKNNNPGNGSNGTSKDLSHWNLYLDPCIDFSKVLRVYMSTTGSILEETSFIPTNKPDPSQTCDATSNVIKFDLGTAGTNTTYYSLLLQGTNYQPGTNKGLFKAGTGCCPKDITGITCKTTWCPYSQGYWFAKPNVEWCNSSVTFVDGPNTLTVSKADGRALWPAQSNTMKKAFFQASALQLSMCMNGGAPVPASILAEYNWLKNMLARSSAPSIIANIPPAGYNLTDIQIAAGKVGTWISANHCADTDDDMSNL